MYSFDVFDTLITRNTIEPKGIFMLMQEMLKKKREYASFFVANFCELRLGAEKLAQQYAYIKGKQEIILEDVYTALATIGCISVNQQKELEEMEVQIEYNNVLGISQNITLLKNLKQQGEHIVLISDMYLKEKHIRDMLSQVDPVFKEIPLYVSSEYGKNKVSGELFQIVRRKENVNYSDWIHYGDNKCADIESAIKLGIKAIHLVPDGLKEYEQPSKNLYHQLSIGVSQHVRRFENNNVVTEVASSLAGPILYPYVKWILKEALERGINRLYFVARDGWILQQIADIIIQKEGYSIKTSYIYGSRKVWRLPSFDGTKKSFGRLLRWSNMDEVITLDDLANVFQLETEILKDFLLDKYNKIDNNQSLLTIQKDNICQQLQENELFRKYIIKSQEENKNKVIYYLQQELDFSDDKFAFVELAGTGLTQKCLACLIGNFYSGQIRNFYFKLDSIQKEEQCKFINFYPSNLKFSFMLELLCRAPHGQTEAYEEKNGKIIPVLEQIEGEQIKLYHIEEYRDAVLAYVRQMEDIYTKNQLSYVPKLDIINEYMKVIAENPPKRIAEYFCHMPFSSGGRKNSMVKFAPDVSHRQLRQIYFWNNGENPLRVYHGNCLEYALAVSTCATKYKEKCIKYRKSIIGKWLIYLYTHQKPEMEYFCPWELLEGNIVIYGAGKVGQSYVKQTKQKYAKCNSLLWVDSNYTALQEKGLQVKSPDDIRKKSFDRVIIAIHNSAARQEIWNKLKEMGISTEKIYFG
ncbi:MAG: hypothetical protein HFI12_11200 [Lachnospiraceae bacterium]|jgi:predicted HAD superfamily hydrolase|nr:hypothetical protein [Lachnospiraceae bacterium]